MNLISLYDQAVSKKDIVNDPKQRQILGEFQKLKNTIESFNPWFSFLKKQAANGIYLHGPVGGGKTYLMDLFYNNLATKYKARFHFHHFMQQIDVQLRKLQGKKDPLQKIAAQVARKTRVICFDEFLVFDVADAMILAELLQALIAKNIILVVTSNTIPDELYAGGVQRDRFLPAIDLIKQHCKILNLPENIDYRYGRDSENHAYLYPLTPEITSRLNTLFSKFTATYQTNTEVLIQNRLIPCIKFGEKTIWFSFDVLCNLPRCKLDYLEIANQFDTIFLSNIPKLNKEMIGQTLLFIQLIDVLYDNGLQLIISAEVPLEKLYTEGILENEFQRTRSRLEEMQSKDFLKRHQRRILDEL